MKKLFLAIKYICMVLLFTVLSCAGDGKTRNTDNETHQSPTTSVYFTGDGKKSMSLGIQVPEGRGLNAALSNIPSMVQGCLVYNIRKYSAISVLDPVALDKVIMETLNGKYEDNLDIVRLGHVAHVGYWMTGKITETPYGYNLQINVTDTTPNAQTLASYNGNCTASQLIDQSAIQIASMELLSQMGVQITEAAKNEMSTTSTQLSIKAQSFLANSRTAERQGGSDIAVYFNAVMAAKFDPSLPEAANRSAILAANISSERTGDNLREDVRWRREWAARLAETELYVKNYNDYYKKYYTDYCNDFIKKYTDNWNKFIQELPEPPYTLSYTVDAHNFGETDYAKNTTSYTGIKAYLGASIKWIQSVQTIIKTMDAQVTEVEKTVKAEQAAVQAAIQEVVKTVNDGLKATGQMEKWKLQPLNVGITPVQFDRSFLDKCRRKQGNQTFSIIVEMVNIQNNKVIGKSTLQITRPYLITTKELSFATLESTYPWKPLEIKKNVDFTNVNINDIPPSDDQLSIRIASVNGTAAETAIKNKVLYIQQVNENEWKLLDYEVKNGQITNYYGKGEDGNLVIPDFIFGEPVTSIGEKAFSNVQLKNITIPKTVTSIGKDAFKLLVNPKPVYWNKNDPTSTKAQTVVVIKIGRNVTVNNSAFTGNNFSAFYSNNKRKAGTYHYIFTTYYSEKIPDKWEWMYTSDY